MVNAAHPRLRLTPSAARQIFTMTFRLTRKTGGRGVGGVVNGLTFASDRREVLSGSLGSVFRISPRPTFPLQLTVNICYPTSMHTPDVRGITYGPKMRALPNDRWRNFVEEFMRRGQKNRTASAEAAGFTGTNDALRVTGSRLSSDPRIREAIIEEGVRWLSDLLPNSIQAMAEILEDQEHKARFEAAKHVQALAGITPKAPSQKDAMDEREQIARIVLLAQQLGMDPRILLGEATPPTPEDEP